MPVFLREPANGSDPPGCSWETIPRGVLSRAHQMAASAHGGAHTRPRPFSLNSVFEILTVSEFNPFPSFPLSPLRCVHSKFAGRGQGGGMHARTYWTHRDRVPWAIERNINPFARLSRMANSRKRSRRRDRPRNRRRPGQEGIRRSREGKSRKRRAWEIRRGAD